MARIWLNIVFTSVDYQEGLLIKRKAQNTYILGFFHTIYIFIGVHDYIIRYDGVVSPLFRIQLLLECRNGPIYPPLPIEGVVNIGAEYVRVNIFT